MRPAGLWSHGNAPPTARADMRGWWPPHPSRCVVSHQIVQMPGQRLTLAEIWCAACPGDPLLFPPPWNGQIRGPLESSGKQRRKTFASAGREQRSPCRFMSASFFVLLCGFFFVCVMAFVPANRIALLVMPVSLSLSLFGQDCV